MTPPTRLYLFEIFEKVEAASTRKDKVAVLQQNNCLAVRDVLKGAFDDSIQFLIPTGNPPYTPADERTGKPLHKYTKRFRYFAQGGPGERIQSYRREKMFIEMLEMLHPKEVTIVTAMKDKKFAGLYKGLTKKIVQEAFPKLIVS